MLYEVFSQNGGAPTSKDLVYSAQENKALYGRKKAMQIPQTDKRGGRCGYFALFSLCHSIPDMV